MLDFTSTFKISFDDETNKLVYSILKDKAEYNIKFKKNLEFTIKEKSLAKLRALTNSLLRDLTIIVNTRKLIEKCDG